MVRVSTTPTPGATQTHCPYCSLQYGIVLSVRGAAGVSSPRGHRVRPSPGCPDRLPGPLALEPQAEFPTNRGGLCSKGWTAASLLDHPQRLLRPLVRTVRGDRTSAFREASWDEALGQVVDGITAAQRAYVAVIAFYVVCVVVTWMVFLRNRLGRLTGV